MGLSLKWNAPVILTYALICTGVFVADKFMMGNLMPFFTVYPSANPSNPLSLLSMVTHIAGHASLEHLLGNVTFICWWAPSSRKSTGQAACSS